MNPSPPSTPGGNEEDAKSGTDPLLQGYAEALAESDAQMYAELFGGDDKPESPSTPGGIEENAKKGKRPLDSADVFLQQYDALQRENDLQMAAELFPGWDESGSSNGYPDSDSGSENSDEDDAFSMVPCTASQLPLHYSDCFLYRWHRATHELTLHLRDNVLLPLDHGDQDGESVFTNLASGVKLPSWHCPFHMQRAGSRHVPCQARAMDHGRQAHTASSHQKELWAHVRCMHGDVLRSIAGRWKLAGQQLDVEEVHLTLFHAALAEMERQTVPRLGLALERRVLHHVGEVLRDDNVQVLMCFMCACKELSHSGFDKFGRPQQKGNICYRRGTTNALINILRGDADPKAEEAWTFNMSAKRFKDRFGDAVAEDPGMSDSCFEWFRNVRRSGKVERVLCCPEDVVRTSKCRHDETFICEKCDIPICNECFQLALKDSKIPRCLANDNFIGYAHEFIVANKVTWLEATIACPVFSGLVTYYIEGDASQRGNMMQETLGKPQRAWAVRGNLFSFLLPWERVMSQLSKDQATVCELVRARIVRAKQGHDKAIS